jgi:ASCH domain
MRILSIRQPWAHAIVHMGKRIENRTWPTPYRGPVILHASLGMTKPEECAFRAFCEGFPGGLDVPDDLAALPRGGIVGIADIVGCRDIATDTLSPDLWFFGPFGFVLRNVRALPFMPLRGALGLRPAPAAAMAHALADWRGMPPASLQAAQAQLL